MMEPASRPAALLLAERILARPHLIHPRQGETISRLLIARAAGLELPAPARPPPPRSFVERDGVAIIPLVGTTVHRGSWLDAECGMVSYTALKRTIAEALSAEEVHAILLDVDSPGGEAAGLFTFARWLLEQRGRKPIWAVANEFCASAAYAIACCCDRVVGPAQAELGSIGVWSYHLDLSGADAKAGHKYTAIAAGAHKGDLWPHAPLSDAALETASGMIQALYSDFIDLVAAARALDAALVRGTEAATMLAPTAVSLGLIDAVQTFDDAFAALAASGTNPEPTPTAARKGNTMPKTQRTPQAMDEEDDPKDEHEIAEAEDKEEGNDDPEAEDEESDEDDGTAKTPAAAAIALMGRAAAAGHAGLGTQLANAVAARKMSADQADKMLRAAISDSKARGATSTKPGAAMSRLDKALQGRNPNLKQGGGPGGNTHLADLAALVSRGNKQ
jgi:capsid assembly protease